MEQARPRTKRSLSVAAVTAGLVLGAWTTIPSAAHAREDYSGFIALMAVGSTAGAAIEVLGTVGAVKAAIEASRGAKWRRWVAALGAAFGLGGWTTLPSPGHADNLTGPYAGHSASPPAARPTSPAMARALTGSSASSTTR